MVMLKELGLAWRLGVAEGSFKSKLRIVKYLYLKKVLRKPVPLCVIVGMSHRCQCSCKFCSTNEDANNLSAREMDSGEVKRLINEIVSLGSVKINFFGGEPLLRPDIVEMVRYASRQSLFVFLDTNGVLLDNEMVADLKESRISCVLVSLSSTDETKHDSLCARPGTHKMAVEGIFNCIRNRVPCVVSVVATKEAVKSGDLKEVINFARSAGASGVRILLPMLSGRWKHENKQLLSSEEMQIVIALANPDFVYIESGLAYLRNRAGNVKCSAREKEIIYVSPFGQVRMCYAAPRSFGNVRGTKLSTIIGNMWSERNLSKDSSGPCLANDINFANSSMRE